MGWTLTTWWNLPESEKDFWFAADYRRNEKFREFVDSLSEKEAGVMSPELVHLMLLMDLQ